MLKRKEEEEEEEEEEAYNSKRGFIFFKKKIGKATHTLYNKNEYKKKIETTILGILSDLLNTFF